MGRPGIWALDGVSFEVKRGEVLGVIGANGTGKSTLLKILSRITEPTGGSAEVRGRVGSLLEVGTGFHPELTGRENIYLNGAILGMRRAEIRRRFDEIVGFSEVGAFIDTPVKHYSSGMYVRLAFSVAAHLSPDVLLVDEVLSVGDAAFQRKCLGKMERASHEGRTVLFISHHLAAVRNLCSRCLWLKEGRIAAVGETQQVVDQYLSDVLRLSETGSRDLSPPALRSGVQKPLLSQIVFQSIELLDGVGRLTGAFNEGAPLTVRLRLRSTIEAEHAVVVVVILSMDGTVICSCCSGDIEHLAAGIHEVAVTVPAHPLRPGTYRVRLYLRTGRWQDVVLEAAQFRVEGIPDPAMSHLFNDPGLWGLVRVDSRWSGPRRIEMETPQGLAEVGGASALKP